MTDPRMDAHESVQELTEQIGKLMHRAGELQDAVKEGNRDVAEVKAELESIKPELARLQTERAEREREIQMNALSQEIEDLRKTYRAPSKASVIGSNPATREPRDETGGRVDARLDLTDDDARHYVRRSGPLLFGAMEALPVPGALSVGLYYFTIQTMFELFRVAELPLDLGEAWARLPAEQRMPITRLTQQTP